MTRVLPAIGPSYLISRVRLQRCRTTGCDRKSRLALVVPCSDIEEDGGPGLGAVVQCGEHLEEALVNLTDFDRKARP